MVRLLLHHEVRHPFREGTPHLPREAVLDFADGDAELDELFLSQMHARPLVAVLVYAGVGEAHAASAAGLEIVGEFREHVVNLLTVLLDAAAVEADGVDDTLRHDALGDVLAVLEQTLHEDIVDVIAGQDLGVGSHDKSFSSSQVLTAPVENIVCQGPRMGEVTR